MGVSGGFQGRRKKEREIMKNRIMKMAFTALMVIFGIFFVKSDAFAASEAEGNNSSSNANAIRLNEAVNGSIKESSDVDWFKFTLQQAGMITLQFDHEIISNTSNYWEVHLYESDGISELNSWYVQGNVNFLSPETGLPSGSYYVKIRGYYGSYSSIQNWSSEAYSLQVNYTESAYWETENNGNVGNADKITLNKVYKGSIYRSGDNDWYCFTTEKAGMVTFQFDHNVISTTNYDWEIHLYESDGVSEMNSWSIYGNKNFLSPEAGLPAGTYYLKIRGYYGSYSSIQNWSNITYSMKVNYTASDYWEKENNNVVGKANVISTNKVYKGATYFSTDNDWYCFTIEKDGMITLQFQHDNIPSTSMYWEMHLYEYDGVSELNSWSVPGNGNFLSPETGLPAGTYYLKVRAYYGSYSSVQQWDNITYSMKVNYTASVYWEKENNNKVGNASAISLNSEYKGAVYYASDNDWYSFKVSKDGAVTIHFDHPVLSSTDGFWEVFLYGSDGVTQMSKWYISGNDNLLTSEIGLSAGNYYLRIRGYYGSYSSVQHWSNQTYSLKIKTNIPDSPANVAAKVVKSGITVTWGKVSDAQKYGLYRRVYSGSSWSGWSTISSSLTGTSYTDKNVTANTKYQYRMRTYNAKGWSEYSTAASIVTPPAAPVIKKATLSNGQVTVTWNASAGATKYMIYRRAEDGDWQTLSSKITTTSYVDKKVKGGKYYYFVKAYGAGGWGNNSSVVNVSLPPTAPVIKETKVESGKITLTWNASASATKYAVYRKEGSGDWVCLIRTTKTTYADTKVYGGRKYVYYVKAYNDVGWSGSSAYARLTSLPDAPETVTAKAYTAKISISWSKVDGATKYALYRRVDSGSGWGNWVKVSTEITATSYADKNVSAKSKYQYKVKACNEAGWGALAASYPVTAK